MISPFVLALSLTGAPLTDAEMKAWDAFAEPRNGECMGAEGELAQPIEIEVGKHKYRLEGHRLVQLDHDRDSRLRIGVLSATKDDREETLDAIRTLRSKLERQGMDILVVNGDLAATDIIMHDTLLPLLAESDTLVLVTAGNTESCGSFNRSVTKTFRKSRNLINGNWVRVLELDDATLVTLPGYHDRRFVHTSGAAQYKKDDVRWLKRILRTAHEQKGEVVVIAHGPPKMRGKAGIDIASGAGHVGDPEMTKVLKLTKTRFGIFGHILEAGGRGSDLDGRKARKRKRWARSLFVNAGTANPDPWSMLGGKTSYGMGLWYEVDSKKARARYQVVKRRP